MARAVIPSARGSARRLQDERAAAALVDSLFESATLGVSFTSTDLRIQRINRALASFHGRSVDEHIGRTLSEVAPHIAALLDDIHRRVIESGEPALNIEFRADSPAWPGEVRDYAANCLPVRADDGEVLGVLAMVQDVTDARRAKQSLQRSEAQFRAMSDASPLGILLTALDGTLLYANRQLYAQMGLRAEEAAELGWRRSIHPEDRDRVFAEVAANTQSGATYDAEHRYLHADGKVVWVRVRADLVLSDESAHGFIALVEDITEKKRLESERLHSQKLESVGRLAGGVAHDFNNLLTVILSHAEFAGLALPADHAAQADIRQIREAGDRAALLTRQLLSFARRQIIQPRRFDLNAVVRDTERMLHRLIGENIVITLDLEEPLWIIETDPSQISQVLINLAVNARDAMPNGGPLTIASRNLVLDADTARTYPGLKPGGYVQLVVRDAGVGMSAEVREHIFEPFYTTKERGNRTGLGLATSYGIVRQSAGYIGAESQPGAGSTFTILLPRASGTPATESAPRAPDLVPGRGVILLVEDEDMVRDMSARALKDRGYDVYVAANAKEALPLAAVLRDRLDLLVTDVIMPGLSGPELAEQVQAMAPRVRCLFISGYAEESIAHHRVLDHGVPFLQKPFVPSRLAEAVRDVLDTRGA